MHRLKYHGDHVRQLIREIGWTKTAIILRGLDKPRSTKRLASKYKDVRVSALRQEFPSPAAKKNPRSKRLFAAYLSPVQHSKLMRYLQKNHDMPKAKGKKVGVSDAFSRMVTEDLA